MVHRASKKWCRLGQEQTASSHGWVEFLENDVESLRLHRMTTATDEAKSPLTKCLQISRPLGDACSNVRSVQ
jgi:hypothetical protein